MSSFPFVLFCFVFFSFMHTYIYEFSCWILFKAHRLVNKHDTKDSNELKEDHNINYSVGFEVWAQFRDKILMHRKLLNSDCSIAYCFCYFFFGRWLKRKPVSPNSMLVNRIIRLVSFLFFIYNFYLFIYLFINCEWVQILLFHIMYAKNGMNKGIFTEIYKF